MLSSDKNKLSQRREFYIHRIVRNGKMSDDGQRSNDGDGKPDARRRKNASVRPCGGAYAHHQGACAGRLDERPSG